MVVLILLVEPACVECVRGVVNFLAHLAMLPGWANVVGHDAQPGHQTHELAATTRIGSSGGFDVGINIGIGIGIGRPLCWF